MKISKLGLNLVRHFEGMYLRGYKCPANVWTIGYGHTGLVDGKPIHGNMIITEEKAIELLQQDMAVFEKAVKDSVKVPLTQNQFDALVSFAFNVGAGALRKSTLLRLLNQGKYEEVPAQFLRWNKGGGKVLAGLTRRRKAEGHLFVTGELKTQF
jgi:lysozyme